MTLYCELIVIISVQLSPCTEGWCTVLAPAVLLIQHLVVACSMWMLLMHLLSSAIHLSLVWNFEVACNRHQGTECSFTNYVPGTRGEKQFLFLLLSRRLASSSCSRCSCLEHTPCVKFTNFVFFFHAIMQTALHLQLLLLFLLRAHFISLAAIAI